MDEKDFVVNVKEVHIQPYRIKAPDKETAIQMIKDGEGEILEGGFVYSHTLSSDTWTTEDYKEWGD